MACSSHFPHVMQRCRALSLRDFSVRARPLAASQLRAAVSSYSTLPPAQQAQVDSYLDALLDWNTRMNLTAVATREEYYERHVNDSLALLPAIEDALSEEQRAARRLHVVDVGSGAGLPGIILAIARPTWQVTLLDSLQKRCAFTRHAAEVSGVGNVDIHWARAEDAGQSSEFREQYDVAVARAVAELRVLAELCLPLVRLGGVWVAAKGTAPGAEVGAAAAAIRLLGGGAARLRDVESAGPEGLRTAVVVAKQAATPRQYPRKPGTPKKSPLD